MGSPTVEYRAQTWVHPAARAQPSPIQGFGLFAAQAFEPGEVISIVGGTAMSDEEFARFAATASRFNAIQVSEDVHLVEDPGVAARTQGSLNHHCDSNLWMLDATTIGARLRIPAGSELTIDYALFTASGEWLEGPCTCGAPSCRVTPGGSDWRSSSLQSRYAGHFSPFLNARIRSLADSSTSSRS